eukprot:1196236-Prorocentrum_minimum.AAC.4
MLAHACVVDFCSQHLEVRWPVCVDCRTTQCTAWKGAATPSTRPWETPPRAWRLSCSKWPWTTASRTTATENIPYGRPIEGQCLRIFHSRRRRAPPRAGRRRARSRPRHVRAGVTKYLEARLGGGLVEERSLHGAAGGRRAGAPSWEGRSDRKLAWEAVSTGRGGASVEGGLS